jgi:hypothetical protein
MLDHIEDGGQSYAVFTFAQKQIGTDTIRLENESGKTMFECCPQNSYSVLIYSSPDLTEGTYTLWNGAEQLAGQIGKMGGRPGGMQRPEGMTPPEGFENKPEEMSPPENFGDRQPPEGMEPPAMPPDGMNPTQRPDDGKMPERDPGVMGEQTKEFKITLGANMFSGIAALSA